MLHELAKLLDCGSPLPLSTCNRYRKVECALVAHACANGGKFRQTVHGLVGRPCHATQDQQPEERIVEGPGVMTENRDKHPSFTLLARPQQWSGLAVFHASGQQLDCLLIAHELPIALIDEAGAMKTSRQRMRLKLQVQRPMPKT